MIKSISKCLVAALFMAISVSSFGQKFGYINSQELLVSLPEVKEADSQLQTFEKQLISKGEDMMKALQTKYQQYSAEAQQGVLSQVQMQQKETELQTEQQQIQQYEVEVTNKIAVKREELYKPILDKVKNAIIALGKEQAYTMIFDTSSGALIHANDSDNLMEQVKGRL